MLAVLTRADQPELFAVLQRLFAHALVVDGEGRPGCTAKACQDIAANDLAPVFWALVRAAVGLCRRRAQSA